MELQLPVFLRIVQESNDTLRRFADKVLSGEPSFISQDTLPMNGDMYQIVNDILECHYEGGLKKMYLLSKTIELMVIQAEAYDKASAQKTKPNINNADVERMNYAREYMTEKFSNPPNLSELSKIIGMSEYKLKQGFKKTFNTTVFGYLADYRLKRAQHALKENHRTISEIAYDLGYSSPQHFSAAFKKKFGLPPRSVKN
jgi:AraC-like DNA-binding protein